LEDGKNLLIRIIHSLVNSPKGAMDNYPDEDPSKYEITLVTMLKDVAFQQVILKIKEAVS
jgi:hypothetical protein